ncbi:reverse transcriptase domain-containing protein [Tanacetum coccineum]
MKVRENDKPSAQLSRFLKCAKHRLEIGLKVDLVEMPKFNKWLSLLLRNKEKLEEIAIMTVNAECSAIIINKVPEKLEDPGKFLIPCALQELNRTNSISGKEELVYYADKSEKNKEKNFVNVISIIDFSKDDPFSGSTTNTLPPSSSPVKTSDKFEKFTDELAPLDSLPPGNDDSTNREDLLTFKSSSSFTLTSLEENKFEAYLERVSIPLGIDLTLPPTLEVLNSNPTSPTLTGEKVDISKISENSQSGQARQRIRRVQRVLKSGSKPEKSCPPSNSRLRIGEQGKKCVRTRSQARNRNRRPQQLTMVIVEEPEIPMADNRTMDQMLQAPIEGYEDAIAPTPQIQGVSKTDFENYVKANDAVLKNVQNQGFAFDENSWVVIASINLLPHSIYKQLGLEALTPTRMTLELANRSITHPMGIAEDVVVRVDGFTFLADFVVVNFELDPRVPIILGRPFLRTAKALIDLYEETLTLRVGKEELIYYADKSEKNKDKNFVHAISIIDFLKDDPFSGSTTNTLPPSSSPVKTSDYFEKFADELTPLDSLPPGNDDSTLKKDLHEETFQIYSNPLFEFNDDFKSSNVNPLIEENNKDVEIKSSPSFTLTLTGEKVCSWKTPMFFSLVRFVWKMMNRIAIRKKIICLLATYLHKNPKPLSHPQEVEEIKIEEDKVSCDVPINTIVLPIRITFDNPIDFNDHFSKQKDFKKDLPISFDFTTTSILPPPLLDSDSPFTAELSASITLNSPIKMNN